MTASGFSPMASTIGLRTLLTRPCVKASASFSQSVSAGSAAGVRIDCGSSRYALSAALMSNSAIVRTGEDPNTVVVADGPVLTEVWKYYDFTVSGNTSECHNSWCDNISFCPRFSCCLQRVAPQLPGHLLQGTRPRCFYQKYACLNIEINVKYGSNGVPISHAHT